MEIIDLIIETMRLAGRTEAADNLEKCVYTDEVMRLKRALLTYLNAVLDELARGYFPIDTVEEMRSETGAYYFHKFKYRPTKIKRVTDGQNPIEWHIYAGYLNVDCPKITVYYESLPSELEEGDDFYYPVPEVCPRLAEYGMLAEYFLVAGDSEAYNMWESKYRSEIEMLLSRSSVAGRIPPRRWI